MLSLVSLAVAKILVVLQSNIGLILHAVGEFDLSLRFFTKALELNTK